MKCISFDCSLLIAACGQDAVCRVASGLADEDASCRELFAKVLCKMQNAPAVQHATAIALLANELRGMLMRGADAAEDAQHCGDAQEQEMLCARTAAAKEMHNTAYRDAQNCTRAGHALCSQSGNSGDAEQRRDADAHCRRVGDALFTLIKV